MAEENTVPAMQETRQPLHQFNLETFKKNVENIIKVNEGYDTSNEWPFTSISRIRDYTHEEIHDIIRNGTLEQQINLSRNYFYMSGFYKRILIHYATLPMYAGVLIPKFTLTEKEKKKAEKALSPDSNNSDKEESKVPEEITKRYHKVLNYVESNNLPDLFTHWAIRALRDGTYYGIISGDDDQIVIIDLPPQYCSALHKNSLGLYILTFDLNYFYSIKNEDDRKIALLMFPKFVQRAFRKFERTRKNSKIIVPAEFGICIKILDGRPFFLNVIESTIDYEDSVNLSKEREAEEIRKIIVQKIPHLNDGQLLFEPDEAVEIHRGTREMLKGNKNINVLTTYADVDSIVSRTSTENQNTVLDSMVNNIYYESGTSGQLFGSNSNMALESSLNNDLAFTTLFFRQFENVITYILNRKFGKGRVTFKYQLLPISYYNYKNYVDTSFKLAQFGYSFILPVLGLGLTTLGLNQLKLVENEILEIGELLIPLSSAYTLAAGQENSAPIGNKNQEVTPEAEKGEPGAPKKKAEDKKPHTLETEKSLDKQGVNNG